MEVAKIRDELEFNKNEILTWKRQLHQSQTEYHKKCEEVNEN